MIISGAKGKIITTKTINDYEALDVSVMSDFNINVSDGTVSNYSSFHSFGERQAVAVVTNGEDVWSGSDSIIPIPSSSGEQMSIVSTSTNDASAGIGVRSLHITYLDSAGLEQTESIILNGTTEVDTAAIDITFINGIHALTVGTNTVAVGDITIYQKGDSSRVYDIIKAGGNMSLTCKLKVPANKTFYLQQWYASVTGNKPVALRLRSTDHDAELHENVYIFKGVVFLDNTAVSVPVGPPIKIPSLSIVKVTAWALQTAANVSAGFTGILITN